MVLASGKTFNVLELAGKGKVVNGYEEYKRRNLIERMDLLSVNKNARDYRLSSVKSENGMKTSAIAVNAYNFAIEKPFSYVPIMGIENPKYYLNFMPDHIHFHMIDDRELDKPLAEKFFASVSKMLRKDGLFFLSADHLMFQRMGQGFGTRMGPFTALSKILAENFDIVAEHYRENFVSVQSLYCEEDGYWPIIKKELTSDASIQGNVLPEAKGIAGSFGFSIKAPGNIVDFFSLFSGAADEYGAYFVIAKKKE